MKFISKLKQIIKKKKGFFFLFIIVIFSFFAVKALFRPGFYTSHDGRHQIIRLMHFHQGLVDGQIPVRWAGTAMKGYGYPLFVFTYRLPFWLAEYWYLWEKNLGNAIKFVFIFTYLLSGLAFYWFSYRIWNSSEAAFISAFLFLWAPYRFSLIFVRAALGEAVTLVFIPLLFLSFWEIKETKEKNSFYWSLLAIFSLAGLILSHFMTLFLWFLPLFLWFLLNLFFSPNKLKYSFWVIFCIFFSFFLTAYYWLPAFWEKQFTIFSQTIGNYFLAHFLSLKQIIYSPWGYGFSFPGIENDQMSFQLGISQWLAVLGAIFLILFLLIKKKTRKDIWKNRKKELFLFFYLFFIFFFSVFMMLEKAEKIYFFTNKFFTLDIPWRFLAVSVFSASFLAGGLIKILKQNFWQYLLIFLFFLLAVYANRNHLRVNQYLFFPESEYWQSDETSNEYDDYTPKSLKTEFLKKEDPLFSVLKGKSKNTLIKKTSKELVFLAIVEEPADISLKIAFYPGWQTFIDGRERETLSDENGKIMVKLNRGVHKVEIIFYETKLRLISDCLSLSAVLALLFLFLKKIKIISNKVKIKKND